MSRRPKSTPFRNYPLDAAVGQSTPRLESREKVTGKAYYTDDMTLPGMLHAAILGSAYAHARILSYDTSAAKALPGVVAVITAEDVEMELSGGTILRDEPFLARGKVRYPGEPVAAVAARDLETARRAARLIEVEYEELEVVSDPEEALRDGAPILHEERDSYFCSFDRPDEQNAIAYTQIIEGDVDQAWHECDEIVEGVYETPAQLHAYMEPVSSLAVCDPNGKVTLWSSTQGVFRLHRLVALSLGIPMSKLRVIAPRIGGGFGGKCDLNHQPIAVALAIATGAPVKLTFSREDDIMMTKTRHASRIYMRTGAKSDGTLVAREIRMYFDGGAYATDSPQVCMNAAFWARGPYRIPNVNIESWSVYTNKVKGGAYRGFGNPQTTFAMESQIDELAQKLNMDPIELRMHNALETGDPWLCGQPVECGSLRSCLDAVRNASGWRLPRPSPRLGKRRGIGVASIGHISTQHVSGATVRLNDDGTVTVGTGAVDVGAGEDTALSQIAAGALGLSIDQINYANADSDSSPYDFQTAASRTIYTGGKAVAEAAARAKERIFEHAGELLECAEDALELRPGGVVGIRGVADAEVTFSEIAACALESPRGPICGSDSWRYCGETCDPKRTTMRGYVYDYSMGIFIFGAQVVELEVDETTGKIEILNVWSAHDVGRAVNPASVEGQIEGGVVQALGFALCEELLFDKGRIVNPTFMDYKILGSADVPYSIHPIVLEHPEESGPFGAKGIGEPGIIGIAAAVANAVRDATDIRCTKIPITGERMLRAWLEKRPN